MEHKSIQSGVHGGGEPWNPGGGDLENPGEPCRSAVSPRSVQTDHIVNFVYRQITLCTDTPLHPSVEKCDHLCKYRWEYPEPIICKYKYRVINNCILSFLSDRSKRQANGKTQSLARISIFYRHWQSFRQPYIHLSSFWSV